MGDKFKDIKNIIVSITKSNFINFYNNRLNKIGIKILAILIFQFIATIILVTVIYKLFTLSKFSDIEYNLAQKDSIKTIETLQNQLTQLSKTNANWSIWDDAYNFVSEPGKSSYIQVNYDNDTIFDLEIDRAIIWNQNGNLIFNRKLDYFEHIVNIPSDTSELEFFNKIYSVKHKLNIENLSGYAVINNKPFLFSITSIKKSDRSKSAGEQLFLREVNEKYLKKLNNLTKENLKISILNNSLNNENQQINLKLNDDHINTSINLNTYDKNKNLEFFYSQNREIYAQGLNSLAYVISIIVACLTLFIVMTFMAVSRYVTKRISLIADYLKNKNASMLKESVEIDGFDEISNLSKSISTYLLELDNLQKKVNHQATLSTIGEMSASIAHELNNPLSVISSKSQMLLKLTKENSIDQNLFEDSLGKIIHTCDRMSKIIKALRSIVRENSTEQNENIDLKTCLLEVESLCHNDLVKNGIKFSIEFDSFQIYGKPVQLMQVFLNLIQNSIHAIKNQPNKWIILYAHEEENYKQIRFTDSGSGIPEEFQNKVMNSFFTTKKAGEGTGLGLSICKRIIEEQHNGEFILDNSNSNTSFILRFYK